MQVAAEGIATDGTMGAAQTLGGATHVMLLWISCIGKESI